VSSPAALIPPEAAPARGPARRRALPALTLAFAAALAIVAFAADGGLRLERTTLVEIGLMAVGAGLSAAALVLRPGRLHGAWALLAIALLAVVTALSIVWSIAPSDSWEETNRTLAYLAVFAGGVSLARLIPNRWDALLHGLALACVLISGWALMTKVFPGWLAEDEVYARLRAPFDYWNAVGLMAALGVPPLLWLAARRSGHAAVNALAWPGLGILLTTLMLSYSRGALLGLVLGLAAWFVLVPLRLRGAVPLIAAIGGAALPVAWAFSQDELTGDRLPVEVRADGGTELGFVIVAMVAGLLIAGLVAGYLTARRAPSQRARDLAGRGVLGALAALALIGLVSVATAPGGIDGQVSKAWNQLTDPDAPTPANTPGRFTAASSVRARYWGEAFDVHAESPWVGAGAGAYATARTRFRTGPLEVRHAHGYIPQVLADLGWLGLAVSLAALAAWLAAASRAIGLRRADLRLPWDAERIGMATLGVVVVVFGVHSLVDWTWFVPANAVAALLAAGWVAGRGPVRARLAGDTGVEVREPNRALLRREPLRAVGAVGVLALGAIAAWAAYQPVRSVHAGDVAIERFQLGQFDAAADIARISVERNPLAIGPRWEVAAIEDARGNRTAANTALEEAVAVQPASAEAWRRLGRYRLNVLARPRQALEAFRAAYYLDPASPEAMSDFLEVSRALEPAP
jgi:hypothetical protein